MPAAAGLAGRRLRAPEVDHERFAALINAAFAIYPTLVEPRTSPSGLAD